MKKQKKFLDITQSKKQQDAVSFGIQSDSFNVRATLFSRGKKTDAFFTEDSKLYVTPREQKLMRAGVALDRDILKWDALSSRIVKKFVRYQPKQGSLLFEALERRCVMMNEEVFEASRSFFGQFSTARLWNASIVGSILFGMVMMTFVYRYLGQGASAQELEQNNIAQTQVVSGEGQVLGVADTVNDAESFAKQVAEIEQIKNAQSLEAEIGSMLKGYPMENMVPYIAQKDRTVAAFIVAIARKESAWGLHAPVLNGQDCYNYWGYRGQRVLMGTGGHTCFNSPQDGVDTVAKRITTLVEEYGKTTPEEMVVWKCGTSCAATGGQEAANKWISDVTTYFDKINTEE